MSENEVATLSRKMDEIIELVMPMSERLKDLPDLKLSVHKNELDIVMMKQEYEACRRHCSEVQRAKKESQVNWGSVKGAIIGTVAAGIVMLAIGIWIGRFM